MGIKKNSTEAYSSVAKIAVLIATLSGCTSAPAKPSPAAEAEQAAYREQTTKLLNDLNNRMQTLETKLNSMNDKIDSTRSSVDRVTHQRETHTTSVSGHPSENAGAPVTSHKSESGFTHDEIVQTFREAMILFQGQKYPESVLAFSEFLEKNPDHPLAASAQFYVAESYMMQKEYKLAQQEFQRILNSYDRSPHVTEALKELSIIADHLKKPDEGIKNRQLLTSLFPQSPAGLTIKSGSGSPENLPAENSHSTDLSASHSPEKGHSEEKSHSPEKAHSEEKSQSPEKTASSKEISPSPKSSEKHSTDRRPQQELDHSPLEEQSQEAHPTETTPAQHSLAPPTAPLKDPNKPNVLTQEQFSETHL